VSNATYGVACATLDAPLIEIGGLTADRIGGLSDPNAWLARVPDSQTWYSWVMNNHWHTNYKADQEGPATFRYSLWPHAVYDVAAVARFGVERSQPLIVAPARQDAPVVESLLRVTPDSVQVTALRPSRDGKALIVRLFNIADKAATAELVWRAGVVGAGCRCTPLEECREPLHGPVELPAWGVATLRYERP
jgi:alpha-mannosidase